MSNASTLSTKENGEDEKEEYIVTLIMVQNRLYYLGVICRRC